MSTGLLMGGGALFGAGVVLLWSAYTHADDADAARTVAEHDRIAGRATTEYVLGGVGIAAGIGLSVLGLYKLSNARESTTLSVTANSGGGRVVLQGTW